MSALSSIVAVAGDSTNISAVGSGEHSPLLDGETITQDPNLNTNVMEYNTEPSGGHEALPPTSGFGEHSPLLDVTGSPMVASPDCPQEVPSMADATKPVFKHPSQASPGSEHETGDQVLQNPACRKHHSARLRCAEHSSDKSSAQFPKPFGPRVVQSVLWLGFQRSYASIVLHGVRSIVRTRVLRSSPSRLVP